MARQRSIKQIPTGRRRALYPNGWPGNLRAALYYNNRKRDRFLPPITQGDPWTEGTWYQVGDTAVYSTVTYECVMTHQARAGLEPNTATDYWRAV